MSCKVVFSSFSLSFFLLIFQVPVVNAEKTQAQINAIWKLIEQGDVDATCQASKILYSGNEVKKNISEAIEFAKFGVKRGHPVCENILGILSITGEGVEQDTSYGLALIKKAADAGLEQAQYNFAIHLLQGKIVAGDPNLAFKYVEKAAFRGYSNAQELVGQLHIDGTGTTKDVEKGIWWYRKASDNGGSAYINSELGRIYSYGDFGVPKDAVIGVKFLQKAILLNDPQAKTILAYLITSGETKVGSIDYAVSLLKEADQQDYLNATSFLGRVLARGARNRNEFISAKVYLDKAASKGDAEAIKFIANEYPGLLNGTNRSASSGQDNTGAQVLLGLLALGLAAAANGSGEGQSESGSWCDLPNYTKSWSKAAKDYECATQDNARYFEEQERIRKQNDPMCEAFLVC